MTCEECERIKSKKHIIYEDKLVMAVLSDKPATSGHVEILPKEHFLIIEKMPDETISHIFSVANKISIACFEGINAQGTNILIKNGIAAGQKSSHASVHVLPRAEEDGLNFQWQTSKASEEDLTSVQTMVQDAMEKPLEEEKPKEEIQEEVKEEIPEGENYQLKQLERVP